MREKEFYVYIMTNKHHTTLYIGVTSDLVSRIWEHRTGKTPGYTSKYRCNQLVYYEKAYGAIAAIHREKQLKKRKRAKKVELINEMNPHWEDLWPHILAW